jgi:hypothetical protein
MSTRTYTLFSTAFFCAGLFVVASFNWLIDPCGQYETRLLKPLVQDSRAAKWQLFQSLESKPDGLIIGSSRVLKIEPEYLESKTGLRFFNAGVNHGRPNDYLAWIRGYEKRWGAFPKVVVLGVDTASLHRDIPIDGRISGEPRFAELVLDRVSWKERLLPWTELLSLKQTKLSARSLLHTLRKTDGTEPIEFFAPNGKIVYTQRESELSRGAYDFEGALDYNRREFHHAYGKFPSLVHNEIFTLVETIRCLRHAGADVYLFNTPFHPELIASLESLPDFKEREAESKELVKILGERFQLRFVDLSRIESFNGDATQFVDGIHPLEANTRRMMDRLFEQPERDRYAIQ